MWSDGYLKARVDERNFFGVVRRICWKKLVAAIKLAETVGKMFQQSTGVGKYSSGGLGTYNGIKRQNRNNTVQYFERFSVSEITNQQPLINNNNK